MRPYVNGTAGFSYFSTTSSVRGRDDADAFAEETNYDETQFAWDGGRRLTDDAPPSAPLSAAA